jgi:protein-S-isoprenylcysteine O-methyltransferase Ste14
MTLEKSEALERADSAEVVFHPPLLLLGSVGLGFAMRWLIPAEFLPREWTPIGGPLLVAASLGVFFWAGITMRREGASIPTGESTNSLVTRGPYRFSRNPIYLSMVCLLMSIGIWANSVWFVGFAASTVALLNWGVISREELYLVRKFGEEYATYKRRVRRW